MPDPGARLKALHGAVARLAAAARALPDPDAATTGEWSGRMVLAHVAFWHESFARNVADLAAGRRPTPLRGTYAELGERARAELGGLDVEALLGRVEAAQAGLRRDLAAVGDAPIPYRQGSRAYGAAEHLRVTAEHVGRHAAELERAARPRRGGQGTAAERARSAAG
jgi:hypothetical protein